MLLRLIAGLIVPTQGEVYWNNKKLHEDISFPGNVGIVIENMKMLPQYTARQNLRIFNTLLAILSVLVLYLLNDLYISASLLNLLLL